MDILVDGNRSSSENWAYSRSVAPGELPPLRPEQEQFAVQLGLSLEDFQRNQLAADLTREDLAVRAEMLGRLVDAWLREYGIAGHVLEVLLRTSEGKFRVTVEISGRVTSCVIEEDVVTSLLESGSERAEMQLKRLLSANFGFEREAKAS
jgi:hypothetical protein